MAWEYNPDAKDIPDHMEYSQDADIPDAIMDWEYADYDPDQDASDEIDWEYNPDAEDIPHHMDCSQDDDVPYAYMDWEYANDDPDPYTSDEMAWE
jgi:hypothetical protein